MASGVPLSYLPNRVQEEPANPMDPAGTTHWVLVWDEGQNPGNAGSGGTDNAYAGSSSVFGAMQVAKKQYRLVTRTFTVPEEPATPPTPATTVARVTTKRRANMQLGWNGGARSIEAWQGEIAYRFQVNANPIGIVTGLSAPEKDVGVGYTEIEYAFHVEHSQYRIVEAGVFKTVFAGYAVDDEFRITRQGSTVRYYVADALVYTSDIPFIAETIIVDASLYAANDAIIDAAVTPLSAEGTYCYGGLKSKPAELAGGGLVYTMAGSLSAHPAEMRGTMGLGGRMSGSLTAKPTVMQGSLGLWQPRTMIGQLVSAPALMGGTMIPFKWFHGGVSARPSVMRGTMGLGGWMDGEMASHPGVMGGSMGLLIDLTSWDRIVATMPVIHWDESGENHYPWAIQQPTGGLSWQPESGEWALQHDTGQASGYSDNLDSLEVMLQHPTGTVRSDAYTLREPTGRVVTRLDAERLGQVVSSVGYCCNLHYADGPETTRLQGGWADFIRILRIGNDTFGVKEDGLYKIGGESFDGEPIQAYATLHAHNYDWPYLQRCRYVYGGFSSAATVTPIVAEQEWGDYETVRGVNQQWRAPLPGGIRDQYWGFKISNIDGQPLKIAWIEPYFEQITRRVA